MRWDIHQSHIACDMLRDGETQKTEATEPDIENEWCDMFGKFQTKK